MPMADSKKTYHLSLFLAIFAVSWAAILIRFCTSPAVVIAFWRLTLSIILLIPIILYSKARSQIIEYLSWDYLKYFIISGFFLSLHFLSWIQSLQYTTVAISVIVVNSSPLWVMLIQFFLYKEKITIYQLIGLFLAFVGVFFISSVSSQDSTTLFPEGVILALIGALMIAFYFVIGRLMRTSRSVPNIPYVFMVNLFCSIFLLFYSLILSENLFNFPLEDFIWFFLLAIGPSLLGHAMLIFAMKKISAQTVSLSVIGESVGASLLSVIILVEPLPPSTIVGGSLILLGIYLNVKSDTSET
ncbi:MAG: hypothetical protein EAX86_05010 [Candidatus Heimdallarchaeota archaeon]|nr:hypothetical protein [Candidatus Heimdallarchaeota archaeon]